MSGTYLKIGKLGKGSDFTIEIYNIKKDIYYGEFFLLSMV